MPLEITKAKGGDELSPRHIARGLRIPEDVRVNRVFYYDLRKPAEVVETLSNRLHHDKIVPPSDSSPSKVLLLGGESLDHQVLMESYCPHIYLDRDSPYKLEARAALMQPDLQILALDDKSIEKMFAPPLDWIPPEIMTTRERGVNSSGNVPLEKTSESKKRKGVMKLSNEGVRAVQHSRTAFQRLAIARGSYECLDYAEKHCSRLDQDSLMENVELILEELRGRDNPNYVATPSSILHAARNLEGEEEEKIDLHERLDRVAHARKREILASLERKEKMKRARSASVQYRSIRRGSTMRHKSLSNVGCAMQPFSPSAPPPTHSSSAASSSSSPPQRRGTRFFSPLKRGEGELTANTARKEATDTAMDEEKEEEDHHDDHQHDCETDDDEPIDSILRRYYSQDEPVLTLRYYSAGSAVVKEEGEVVLDGSFPGVSCVERDRRVSEAQLQARMVRRGEELGLYDPKFAGEQPEMRAARRNSRGATLTRQRVEAEVADLKKKKNDRRTRNVIAEARMRQLRANVSAKRELLESQARDQVEDHRYHLPSKLHSWLGDTSHMLAVGADATLVPRHRVADLMMWWTDDGAGDLGQYEEYLQQHAEARRLGVRARVDHRLLGPKAPTHAEARTFLTQTQTPAGAGAGAGAGKNSGKTDFVDFIGRANVRETIRLGSGSGVGAARTTKPMAANLVGSRRGARESYSRSGGHEHANEDRKRASAKEITAERKSREMKLSDDRALELLRVRMRQVEMTRVRQEAWLVTMLKDLKSHVDERRKLAVLQRQSKKSSGTSTGTGTADDDGGKSSDISMGLLKFSLTLAWAVQLGFTLSSGDDSAGDGSASGSGDVAGKRSQQDGAALLLPLFSRCFSSEDLRNEAVFRIILHAMHAAGLNASALLLHIRSCWGPGVEVALK